MPSYVERFETSPPARLWALTVAVAAGYCLLAGVVSLIVIYDFHSNGMYAVWEYTTPQVMVAYLRRAFGLLGAGLALACVARLAWQRRFLVGSTAIVLSGFIHTVYAAGILPAGTPRLVIGLLLEGGLVFFGLRLFQLFPGRITAPALRSLPASAITRGFNMVLGWLLDVRVLAAYMVAVTLPRALPEPGPLFLMARLTFPVLMFGYLVAGLRLGSDEQRQRSFWLAQGVLMLVVAYLMAPIHRLLSLSDRFGPMAGHYANVGYYVFCILSFTFIALAIFRFGVADSRVVLRRSAIVAGALGGAMVVFAVLENVLVGAVFNPLGIAPDSAPLVSTVLAAVAFAPIQNALTHVADRARDRLADDRARHPVGLLEDDAATTALGGGSIVFHSN